RLSNLTLLPYTTIFRSRTRLYEQINLRVDLMIEAGLEDEVRKLYEAGLKDSQSMRAIGYKEFIPYFEGEMDLAEAVELLKRNSRDRKSTRLNSSHVSIS